MTSPLARLNASSPYKVPQTEAYIYINTSISSFILILWPLNQYYGFWHQYHGFLPNVMDFDPLLWPLLQYYNLWPNIMALNKILWLRTNIVASDQILLPLIHYSGLWLNIMAFDISIIAFYIILWTLIQYYGLWTKVIASGTILWALTSI